MGPQRTDFYFLQEQEARISLLCHWEAGSLALVDPKIMNGCYYILVLMCFVHFELNQV
jgi:hypothetical protein